MANEERASAPGGADPAVIGRRPRKPSSARPRSAALHRARPRSPPQWAGHGLRLGLQHVAPAWQSPIRSMALSRPARIALASPDARRRSAPIAFSRHASRKISTPNWRGVAPARHAKAAERPARLLRRWSRSIAGQWSSAGLGKAWPGETVVEPSSPSHLKPQVNSNFLLKINGHVVNHHS